jgi:hypothetical protein
VVTWILWPRAVEVQQGVLMLQQQGSTAAEARVKQEQQQL